MCIDPDQCCIGGEWLILGAHNCLSLNSIQEAALQIFNVAQQKDQGLKTYYARLNFMQLQAVRQDTARLWLMTADPLFDDAAFIGGQEELEQLCTALAAAALQAGAAGLPIGQLVAAIQGNAQDAPCPEVMEVGLGTGCVLSPVTVQTLSAALKAVSPEALRTVLTGETKAGADRPAGIGPASLNAALTAFAVLQQFYFAAAGYGQYVLVVRAPSVAS